MVLFDVTVRVMTLVMFQCNRTAMEYLLVHYRDLAAHMLYHILKLQDV